MNLEKIVRSHLLRLKPYSSARDDFKGSAEIWLDANENPFENGLNRYPDPHQKVLKRKISLLKLVQEEQILLCNGSDECIDLLIRLCCAPEHDEIIICPPTYGLYEVSANIQNVRVREVPLKSDFSLDTLGLTTVFSERSKLLFICSPNNPTGNTFQVDAIEYLLVNFPGLVVVDEAYIDFSDKKSWLSRLSEYDNLVVLQTFSKAWGMAGARVGMCFANPQIIELLKKIKPPYNISSMAQAAVEQALDKADLLEINIASIVSLKNRLFKYLSGHPMVLKVYASDANFLLFQCAHPDIMYKDMVESGIVVRNRSSQTHCDGCLRISIGTEIEMDKVIGWFEALRD